MQLYCCPFLFLFVLLFFKKKNRALLFKTDNVISIRDIKLSNINISNMQIFLLKKCEKLLHCKSFSHFFQQKISANLAIKL